MDIIIEIEISIPINIVKGGVRVNTVMNFAVMKAEVLRMLVTDAPKGAFL